jgi:hypothetical protein
MCVDSVIKTDSHSHQTETIRDGGESYDRPFFVTEDIPERELKQHLHFVLAFWSDSIFPSRSLMIRRAKSMTILS